MKQTEVYIVKVNNKWQGMWLHNNSTWIIQPDNNLDITAFREKIKKDFKELGIDVRVRHLDNIGIELHEDRELTEQIEKLKLMKEFNSR